MHIAVDPVLLQPPAQDPLTWLAELKSWQKLLDEGPFTASCPIELSQQALSLWYQHRETFTDLCTRTGCALTPDDFIRVLDPFRGRLADTAFPSGVDALLDSPAVEPSYCPAELDQPDLSLVVHHLAQAAARRHLEGKLTSVMTRPSSWEDDRTEAAVTAEMPLLSIDDDDDPTVEERSIRELLPLWRTESRALNVLAEHCESLIDHPQLAVRAMFATLAAEGTPTPGFSIGPNFSTSLHAMGYHHASGRATTCFRAMALIAAGRTAELSGLEAHPQRTGPNGNDPYRRDDAGRMLYRGYLANKSPGAHRLFWWSGEEPEFVGIAYHDDEPPL
jgi:hypothetical protein